MGRFARCCTLPLLLVALLCGVAHPGMAQDFTSSKSKNYPGKNPRTVSGMAPWADCVTSAAIIGGSAAMCAASCSSSSTNPFSAKACYGCLAAASGTEIWLVPQILNCVCYTMGQGYATPSGECRGRKSPRGSPFCPFQPSVQACQKTSNGTCPREKQSMVSDCGAAVTKLKQRMPDEFNKLPVGSYGVCVAKCTQNTADAAASCGPCSEPTAVPVVTNEPTAVPFMTTQPGPDR